MEEGEDADEGRAGEGEEVDGRRAAEPSAVAAAGAPVAVRVAVRVRPLSERERAMGCRECVAVQGAATTLSAEPGGGNGKEDKTFVFDFSYWHDVPQGVVYRDLAKPIVEAALDGFNGVIFVRRRAAQRSRIEQASHLTRARFCCVRTRALVTSLMGVPVPAPVSVPVPAPLSCTCARACVRAVNAMFGIAGPRRMARQAAARHTP